MQLEPGQAQQLAALIDYQDDHRSDRLERLREAFDRTGIGAEIPEDVDAALSLAPWERRARGTATFV